MVDQPQLIAELQLIPIVVDAIENVLGSAARLA
jgi:hypothetical protein